jgi:hypothetical protein
MANTVISEDDRKVLLQYLEENKDADLVNTYLCFIGKSLKVQPVLYIKEKLIYKDADELIERLEKKGQLWRETEIKIGHFKPSVNEQTKKIYICPFTGKVFADNTHPNPQDAIYDWVSTCPENTEMVGGLKPKRFFVSEDPDVIKNYIPKDQPEDPISKTVYSSALTGKLFNSREAVLSDFRKNYLKPMTLVEVPNQNRYKINQELLDFLQELLVEEKITSFVEVLSEFDEFGSYVEQWVGSE